MLQGISAWNTKLPCVESATKTNTKLPCVESATKTNNKLPCVESATVYIYHIGCLFFQPGSTDSFGVKDKVSFLEGFCFCAFLLE